MPTIKRSGGSGLERRRAGRERAQLRRRAARLERALLGQDAFRRGQGHQPGGADRAAHAGCFSMALAFGLGGGGHKPEELRTSAVVTIEKEGAGWTVKSSA